MTAGPATWADAIGLREDALVQRFGPPSVRRVVGEDLWLTFEAGAMYRVVCRPADGGHRVASWTAKFSPGLATLAEAAESVGLWPAAEPDVAAVDVGAPLARRALVSPDGACAWSLTATVKDGRFTNLTVFDEAPDWL